MNYNSSHQNSITRYCKGYKRLFGWYQFKNKCNNKTVKCYGNASANDLTNNDTTIANNKLSHETIETIFKKIKYYINTKIL